jgi:DNA (cytosine-5)-methyltransferase 1
MHAVSDHVSGRLSELDRLVVESVPPGGNWRNLPDDFPSQRIKQIRQGASSGGGSRSTYYGRLMWDRPAYTISTYLTRPGNGCFIHPSEDRLISLREAARIQTFPDSVKFQGSLRARCVQVGNAVPPLLAYHVGSALPPGSVIDLFAGAGGIGMGLALAGHDVVLSTDIDANACKTLSTHASDGQEIVQADLADSDDFEGLVSRSRETKTAIDLVVGGPPCQGFSTAGPCRVDDPRNNLVLAFLRFIDQTRPRRVLMENVPALRWRGSHLLDEVRDRLMVLGYETDVVIVHAEAYGVPQLRRRLILQGTLEGKPLWPNPTSPLVNPAFPRDQPGQSGSTPTATVRDAIGDLPPNTEHDLDAPTRVSTEPQCDLQRWLRGDATVESILNGRPSVVAGTSVHQGRLLP